MKQIVLMCGLALFSFIETDAMITAKKPRIDFNIGTKSIAEEVEELVTLHSSDGLDCLISKELALLSGTLTLLMEDAFDNPIFKLPHISGWTLTKVVAILERLVLLNSVKLDELKKYTLSHRQALASESELIKALHYLQIPIVVFTSTDGTLEIVPLKKAIRSDRFKGFIELEKLDKTVHLSKKSS